MKVLIAVLVLVSTIALTLGDYVFKSAVVRHRGRCDRQGSPLSLSRAPKNSQRYDAGCP